MSSYKYILFDCMETVVDVIKNRTKGSIHTGFMPAADMNTYGMFLTLLLNSMPR